MTKLENVKNGPKHKKFYKKMLFLVISRPENHNLRRKNAKKIEFDFNRKKKHFFIAHNKLQVDQIKKKQRQSSKGHYLFKKQKLLKVKTIVGFHLIC